MSELLSLATLAQPPGRIGGRTPNPVKTGRWDWSWDLRKIGFFFLGGGLGSNTVA